MTEANLISLFKLEKHLELYKTAITPKSCGGGDEFGFLALFGDKILDLMLLHILSETDIKNTGDLTKTINSFHNERTLSALGYHLQIDQFLHPIDPNHEITPGEIKESVESLLGATYEANDLEACRAVVEILLDKSSALAKDLKTESLNLVLFDDNPKGKLGEIFDQLSLPRPVPHTIRVGGPDHNPLFQSTLEFDLFKQSYKIQSDFYQRKMDAERDVAQKALFKLGMITQTTSTAPFTKTEKKIAKAATQSLSEESITFSKREKTGIFQTGEMKLSTETGESIASWANRKARKNPFAMLVLLSARLDEVSGSALVCIFRFWGAYFIKPRI